MIHALLAIVFLFPTTMQDKDKIDSKLIIGKWDAEVVPDGIDKITVEFTNDNKLHLHLERSGEKQKVSGTYKVDGNKLEVKLEIGDETQEQKRTITKLTADELLTKDDEGNERKYKKSK